MAISCSCTAGAIEAVGHFLGERAFWRGSSRNHSESFGIIRNHSESFGSGDLLGIFWHLFTSSKNPRTSAQTLALSAGRAAHRAHGAHRAHCADATAATAATAATDATDASCHELRIGAPRAAMRSQSREFFCFCFEAPAAGLDARPAACQPRDPGHRKCAAALSVCWPCFRNESHVGPVSETTAMLSNLWPINMS